jgi:hypothetical protein
MGILRVSTQCPRSRASPRSIGFAREHLQFHDPRVMGRYPPWGILARLRRYAVGVWPVALRNAVVNELVSRKPTAIPISVTDDADSTNNVLARSMRWLLWYRCGGVPNDCLKARQKWYGLRLTNNPVAEAAIQEIQADSCPGRHPQK